MMGLDATRRCRRLLLALWILTCLEASQSVHPLISAWHTVHMHQQVSVVERLMLCHTGS